MRTLLAVIVFGMSLLATAAAEAQKKKGKKPAGPKRWAKAIAKFEMQDKKSAPPKNGILFVGSSSIRLWKLGKSFPDLKAINRGFGGSQIADSNHYIDQLVLKHQPRIVVLYAGDNDVARGKSPERVANDFARFVKLIHKPLPKTRILFIAIKPSLKRWNLVGKMKAANALIEKQCKANDRLQYIDIFTPMLGDDGKPKPNLFAKDDLHLNPTGYKLWAGVLRPYLK